MKKERLDKILSHYGYGSRKDCKKLLHSGAVQINGNACFTPETQVDVDLDKISVDGQLLDIKENVYIMMNKCQDVVSSTKDGIHATVLDLLSDSYKISFLGGEIHPVGRLDIDTEGLLLLTTDGALTHRLISPKNHVPKTYYVKLRDSVNLETQKRYSKLFEQGLNVIAEGNEEAFTAQSAKLTWSNQECENQNLKKYLGQAGESTNEVLITITEGKYHQVKRMFLSVQNEVVFLKRVSIGSLYLDESLKPGEYRELTSDELKLFVE